MYTAKKHASDTARNWLDQESVFFDTETTRIDGEIVDLALVDCAGKVLLSTLVHPCELISPEAEAVHSITNEMVANAPTFDVVWEQFRHLTANKRVIIYNAQFDMRMLRLSSLPYPDIKDKVTYWTSSTDYSYYVDIDSVARPRYSCAMKLYSEYAGVLGRGGQYKWHKLDEAARQCGILCEAQIHRAQEDAELTRLLVLHMAQSER